MIINISTAIVPIGLDCAQTGFGSSFLTRRQANWRRHHDSSAVNQAKKRARHRTELRVKNSRSTASNL